LSPRQLEAVIAHELAHVRRLDYLVNVFQTVAETLLFYHPAIWWLSRRIRIEREHCADDVAVAACGDAVLYAEALAELEGSRTTTSLAIGATGGSLVTRIRRILGQPEGRHRPASAWLAISTTAVILMLAFTGSGTTAVATPAEPEIALLVSPEAQESQTVTVEPREIEREIEREVLRVVETETEQVEPILNVTVAQEAVAQEAVAQQITIQSVEPVEPILRVAVEPETTIQSVEREIAVAQVQVDPFRRLSALQSIQDTPFGSIRTIGAGDGSYIGIDIQDGAERGVLVSAIADDGPASQAGLEEGDLITSFDGTAVIGVRQFTRLTEETPVGRTVAFTLSRDGQEQIVEVTLSAHPSPFQNFTIAGRGPGDRPIFFGQEGDGLTTPSLRLNERGDFSAPSIVWTEGDGLHLFLAGGQGTLGLTVESMTRELRQFFGADSDEGILIVSIEDESLGAAAGLQVGDVIIAVDGNSVDSDSDVRELARAVFATGNSITLRIVRDRSERDVVVEEESD
jgi:membrane-associated protease RseP (regulator of RpoE activity)